MSVLWKVLALMLVTAISTAHSPNARSAELVHDPCPRLAARVVLSKNEKITINGVEVSLDGLSDQLRKLPSTVEVICYYHADQKARRLTPAAAGVLDAIIDTNIRVAFYRDERFQKRFIFTDGE